MTSAMIFGFPVRDNTGRSNLDCYSFLFFLLTGQTVSSASNCKQKQICLEHASMILINHIRHLEVMHENDVLQDCEVGVGPGWGRGRAAVAWHGTVSSPGRPTLPTDPPCHSGTNGHPAPPNPAPSPTLPQSRLELGLLARLPSSLSTGQPP